MPYFDTNPKYVVSTTLTAPLEWEHSTLLEGDLGDAVTGLKQEDGDDGPRLPLRLTDSREPPRVRSSRRTSVQRRESGHRPSTEQRQGVVAR